MNLAILAIVPFIVMGIICLKLARKMDWFGRFDKTMIVGSGISAGFCFLMVATIVAWYLIRG
jgi:hypothetical protein